MELVKQQVMELRSNKIAANTKLTSVNTVRLVS